MKQARNDLPPAIPAATVVVIRDADGGLETLMLRRNSRIAFGGMWVFPGGRIDEGDTGDDEVETALRCAVREAAEEADLVLDRDRLVPFAHWEPPPVIPKRFATWFFLAPAPAGEDGTVLVDGGEIHEHQWRRPEQVLRERDQGLVEVAPPTWVTLHQLASLDGVEGALSWASERSGAVERYVTHWSEIDGGAVAMWHGDAGYDRLDPMVEGGRHRLWMLESGWRFERSVP